MSIKCYLVTMRLSAMSADLELSPSMNRHIEQCERCKKEAAAYSNLRKALWTSFDSAEKCEITWAEMRTSAAIYPDEVFRSRWTLILAASAACILLIALIGMWTLHPSKNKTVTAGISYPVTLSVDSTDTDQPPQVFIVQPDEPNKANIVADKPVAKPQRTLNRRVVRIKHPAVAVAKQEKPGNSALPPKKETVTAVPSDKEDNMIDPAAISDEEHVIGVLNMNLEASDTDDLYVIEQSGQHRYVLVDL